MFTELVKTIKDERKKEFEGKGMKPEEIEKKFLE
jgi:hypothetical protein